MHVNGSVAPVPGIGEGIGDVNKDAEGIRRARDAGEEYGVAPENSRAGR